MPRFVFYSYLYFLQKLLKLEKLDQLGEFEEIRLSEKDYDASQSSLEISCHTHNENNEQSWRSYRDFKLQRVGYNFYLCTFLEQQSGSKGGGVR